MNAIKVSIIIAAYNVEKTIDEAIQSVLSQQGISFELLIGDDASVDATWDRVENYGEDPRVKGFRFRSHRGAAWVWNRLVVSARGQYISVCDADDMMLPGNLSAASRVLDRFSSIGVISTQRRYINELGKTVDLGSQLFSPHETWDLIRMVGAHGGSMFRREVLQRVGGYRGAAGYADAYDLFLRLSEVTQLALLPGRPLYAYRIHSYSAGYYNGHYKRRLESERMAVREAIFRRYGVKVSW